MSVLTAQPTHRTSAQFDFWVDERIWGHRFHNDQSPWLLLLEFFGVFIDRHRAGRALTEPRIDGAHEDFSYRLALLEPVRYLVFNNPYLGHIEQTVDMDSERWRRWLEAVADNPRGVDFSYLKDRFGQFSRLARVIEFFQSSAVEARRQRRWSSRFLYPYGPDCIYADLKEKRGLGGPDRRFFARGGELLYLMLARSGRGEALAERINACLMNPNGRWSRLVSALLPGDYDGEQECTSALPVGYLPYAEREEYGALADDWLVLLGLDLPGNAVLDPLMRITGLHLLLYLLRRSHEELANGAKPAEPCFVLEIAAPRRTPLFELSEVSCRTNRGLSRRAVEAHVRSVTRTGAWQEVSGALDPSLAARTHLKQEFRWDGDGVAQGTSPERVLRAFTAQVLERHDHHAGKVVPEWSRRIGLLAARRGTGTWYAPEDAFLKALVLTTVAERMEYHRFLGLLYEKYRLVIAGAEAEQAYGKLPADRGVFDDNARRLEQRLRALGLLKRLSDDCAYVINPFRAET